MSFTFAACLCGPEVVEDCEGKRCLNDGGAAGGGAAGGGAAGGGAAGGGAAGGGAAGGGAAGGGAAGGGAAGGGAAGGGGGPGDAGLLWLTLDGGNCAPSPYASVTELASTPREHTWFEGLGIESTGSFVCDESTYRHIEADYAHLRAPDSGQPLFGLMLDHEPSDLSIEFDSVGLAAVQAGTYRDWDCLNFTYRATRVEVLSFAHIARVSFHGAYDVTRLAGQYAALPHVTSVRLNSIGVLGICGAVSDACLEIDGGSFTYLGMRDDMHCNTSWYLVFSASDGGMSVQSLDDEQASAWRQQHVKCARNLWGHAQLDGGVR